MRKILILGPLGSGKTTLAKKISQKTKIPFFSLDNIIYNKKWKKRPKRIREKSFKEKIEKKEWIIEGRGPSKWRESLISKADTIILLDFPRKEVHKRIMKRYKRGRKEKTVYGKLYSRGFRITYNLLYSLKNRKSPIEKHMKGTVKFFPITNSQEESRILKSLKK